MQSPLGVSFENTFQLLGYTLEQREVAPGGLLPVTLFWRAEKPIEREYRPVVQLVNLHVSEAWGASEPFFPGGGHTPGYPTDKFASDVHELRVFADAPPYVGQLSVQMLDAATGEPLRLADGRDRILLDPLVRVTGHLPEVNSAPQSRYTFADALELRCATVTREAGTINVTLHWHTLTTPPDIVAFIHALDDEGNMVNQVDRPPLDGLYPSALWLPGQNLTDDIYKLPFEDVVTQIFAGLYRPESGERLTVTQSGQPVPNNAVPLPAEGTTCPR
jgi:hypothetical protein